MWQGRCGCGAQPAVAQNLKRCWQNRVAIICHGRRLFLARPLTHRVTEARGGGAVQVNPQPSLSQSGIRRPVNTHICVPRGSERERRAVAIGGQEAVGRPTDRHAHRDAEPTFFLFRVELQIGWRWQWRYVSPRRVVSPEDRSQSAFSRSPGEGDNDESNLNAGVTLVAGLPRRNLLKYRLMNIVSREQPRSTISSPASKPT